MFGRSVRASRDERLRALPGDDIISEPIASLTHAITIRRAPRDVVDAPIGCLLLPSRI